MSKFNTTVKNGIYIINKGDVFLDEEANVIEEKVYILVIDSYKEIYLNLNYGTYDFVKGDKTIFEELKPFAVVNNYVEDHPLIGEKMIYKNYYVIDSCKDNYDLNKLKEVPFVNLKELIQNNMYDNPRNRERTEEILEVISFL